jgi:hypothetical protein
VDVADGVELEGAEIQILRKLGEDEEKTEGGKYIEIGDESYEVVEEWKSSKEETHVVEGLLTGTEYTLHETVAPHGYDVTTDTTFTIDEYGKITSTGSITYDENDNPVMLVEDEMLTVSVAVKKIWKDEDNRDGVRPVSLQVDLLGDGTVCKTVTLEEGNGWAATVKDLPMVSNKDLHDIEYTWQEHDLSGTGYELTGTVKNGTLTTLTNTYGPAKTDISVNKVWEDNDNAANYKKEKGQVIPLK